MTKNLIPIFYACDENFLNYAIVSLFSLRENAKSDALYRIHLSLIHI